MHFILCVNFEIILPPTYLALYCFLHLVSCVWIANQKRASKRTGEETSVRRRAVILMYFSVLYILRWRRKMRNKSGGKHYHGPITWFIYELRIIQVKSHPLQGIPLARSFQMQCQLLLVQNWHCTVICGYSDTFLTWFKLHQNLN